MENKTDEDFMRMAIELSEFNIKHGLGGPFGAVIAKEGILVASSSNKVIPENDPTAHAEISAIRLACRALGTINLSGCQIYTSCEPCPMCLGAIYWARIDKVFYANTKDDAAEIGFDDLYIYDELTCQLHERKLPFFQLLRDEALLAFKKWDVSSSKTLY